MQPMLVLNVVSPQKKSRIAEMLQILHVSPYNDHCRRHYVSSLLVPECNFHVECKMTSTNVGLTCGKNDWGKNGTLNSPWVSFWVSSLGGYTLVSFCNWMCSKLYQKEKGNTAETWESGLHTILHVFSPFVLLQYI